MITDLTQSFLEAKCQQDKVLLCHETSKIQAITCIMLFFLLSSYSREFGAQHPTCNTNSNTDVQDASNIGYADESPNEILWIESINMVYVCMYA